MEIAIYSISSALHKEVAGELRQDPFLNAVAEAGKIEMIFYGSDFSTYGKHPLSLIYIRTGGTESAFCKIYPSLKGRFLLLTSGESNSLAASMEILSYLHQQERQGEILHGKPEFVAQRIHQLEVTGQAETPRTRHRLGIVGAPSDWLVASDPDRRALSRLLDLDLIEIPMYQFLNEIRKKEPVEPPVELREPWDPATTRGALEIYGALKRLVATHRLEGLTVRCFDLLTSVKNTGCLALALLNSEGIPASCEGDIPSMVSMLISQHVAGVSGFMANPSRIDPDAGKMIFAHCTVPFNILTGWRFDTHFESGIGMAVKGIMPLGPVTIFKVSPDLRRRFIYETMLTANPDEPTLCRTQVEIEVDRKTVKYFMTDPIGNHHIIIPGHWKKALKAYLDHDKAS